MSLAPELFNFLGYFAQPIPVEDAPSGAIVSTLWQVERGPEGAQLQKSRVLVLVSSDTDLRAKGKDSISAFVRKLMKEQKLGKAILTDGSRWVVLEAKSPVVPPALTLTDLFAGQGEMFIYLFLAR